MKNKIIFSSLFLLLYACGGENKEVPAIENTATGLVLGQLADGQFQFERVELRDYVNPLIVVGEVSFDEDHVVRVFPIVSGSVEEVHVSLGDYVKKGQLLARVLSTDISSYQLAFNVAKSNLEISKRNLDRIKTLFEGGFASEKELLGAESDWKIAMSDFTSKKQVLELYGGSTVNNDATFLVFAPNDGYIVERNLNAGMQIRPDNSESLFTISDLKTVWIWANIYESDISKIALGDTVRASTISYPDSTFIGVIEKINHVLDPESRVVRVRTELRNPNELLKPEMFATVKILPQQTRKAIAVPTKAVFLENNTYCVITRKNGAYFKTGVETAQVIDDRTEIILGLERGDTVVVKGALFIASEINAR